MLIEEGEREKSLESTFGQIYDSSKMQPLSLSLSIKQTPKHIHKSSLCLFHSPQSHTQLLSLSKGTITVNITNTIPRERERRKKEIECKEIGRHTET